MINYIIRRVLWAIPVLLIISLVTFSLAHVIPEGINIEIEIIE